MSDQLMVILGTTLLTWLSVLVYLFRLERKIRFLEQQLTKKESNDER